MGLGPQVVPDEPGRPGLAGWPCLAGRWAAWLAKLACWLARSGRRRKNAVPSQLACLAGWLAGWLADWPAGFCLPVCLSAWLSVFTSACLCACLCVCLSVCLFVSLSVCPFVVSLSLSPYPPVCLSVGLPVCLSARPSVRSVRLLVAWSAWLALPGRRPARPRSGRHETSAPPLLLPQVGYVVGST